MIRLTATEAGFHTISPLLTSIAPAAFLRAPSNMAGQIVFDSAEGRWLTTESLRYPEHQIELVVHAEGLTATDAQYYAPIQITEILFSRGAGEDRIEIGRMDLGEGLALMAENANYGLPGGQLWHCDIATALEDMLQEDGFQFRGGDGDDFLSFQHPILPVRGEVILSGRGGDDRIHGSMADDKIFGGQGNDYLSDNSGENRLIGGSGNDILALGLWSENSLAKGGLGNDRITSSNGSDLLFGGAGADHISGGRGDDLLVGNRGDDRLEGGEGHDRISGGRGDDTLSGGDDADIFIFACHGSGSDVITDFQISEDHLRIRGVDSFADITLTQESEGTRVAWSEGNGSVLLEDVAVAALGADQFLF